MARKDLLSRLADAGEEALARLADAPGSDRILGFAHNMRERMDELQKKVRGLEELERRVAALERQAAASGGTRSGSRAPAKRGAASASAAPAAKAKPKPKAKPRSSATEASRSRAAKTGGRSAGSTRRTGGGSPG